MIEVLIAATILFASITIISDAYRTSMQSTRRAETVIRMLTPLPMIVSKIQSTLRSDPIERATGEGELLGVRYVYSAEGKLFAPPPRRFDPDQAEFTAYAPRYRLYDVRLQLAFAMQKREFVYQELAWLPAARR